MTSESGTSFDVRLTRIEERQLAALERYSNLAVAMDKMSKAQTLLSESQVKYAIAQAEMAKDLSALRQIFEKQEKDGWRRLLLFGLMIGGGSGGLATIITRIIGP